MSVPFERKDGFRELTRDEIHAEMRELYRDHCDRVERRADGIAFDYPAEGRDLLHDAMLRALTSRSCREDLTAEQFLGGIMRSIASTARRGRERRQENPVVLPVDEATERMAVGGYVVQTADEIIETSGYGNSASRSSIASLPHRSSRLRCSTVSASTCVGARSQIMSASRRTNSLPCGAASSGRRSGYGPH